MVMKKSIDSIKITVIIPVYNGDYCLQEAIKSVIYQTYVHWELLLVDDCSTDQSRRIIEEYLAVDNRISSLYHNNNYGLYGSLVKAVDHVDSEYIVILMQDDHLKSCYLEEMTKLLNKYPEILAFWATEDTIDKNSNILRKGLDTGRCEMINHGVAPWISVLSRGCIWIISGSLTSRSLLLENPFRVDLPHCADYEWLLRVIRKSDFVYYERPLSEIRIHARAASAKNLKIGKDIQEGYAIIKENLLNHSEDIPLAALISISFRRAKITALRLLGQIRRGELTFSRLFIFLSYVFMYLSLPLIKYKQLNYRGKH
jgi:glycosyltransferase involved in cell wall biosynthesis